MYKATKKAVKEDEVFKATSRATVDYAVVHSIKSGLEKLNTDYTDLYTSYNSRFFDKDGNFTDSYGKTDNDSEYENYSQKAARLNNEIGEIQNHLKKYGNLYDSESLKNINAMLENASGGIKNMGQAYEFYSNFHTENDYNAYIMNNTADLDGGMSAEGIAARVKAHEKVTARLEAIDNEIADMSDEEKWVEVLNPYNGSQMAMQTVNKPSEKHQELLDEKAYLEEQTRLYEGYNKENDSLVSQFADSADFKVNSVYVPREIERDENGRPLTVDYKTFLEFYNESPNLEDHTYVPELAIDSLKGKKMPDEYYHYASDGGWNYATEDEFKMLNYLANNQGDEVAQSYFETLSKDLSRRKYIDFEKARDENYKNAKWYEKVGLNIASVPEVIIGGLNSGASYLMSLAMGEEYDPYDEINYVKAMGDNTRKNTAYEIDDLTENAELLGVSWGDAYQAAMSGIDSVVGAATFGKGYTVIMGMGAASSKAKQLYEQGASNGQIAAASLFAGTAEMLFERLSIGYFLDEFVNAPARKWYVNLLKASVSGGIEMSEEMATELANTFTDVMVLGSRSEWKKIITSYKEQGYSDSDAVVNAMWDKGGDILEDGIMGFISGGGMGSVGAVINATNTNKAYDKFYKQTGGEIVSADNIKSLVAKAKALDNTKANAKVKALAAELEGVDASKLNEKEKTAFEKKAGQLYEAVLEAQNKQGKASFDTAKRNIIRDQLNKKGITDEAEIEAATQAIMKVVYNKGALTAKESELLEKVGGNEIASYLINNAAEVTANGIVTSIENKAKINEIASLTKKSNTYVREVNTDGYIYSDDGKTYIDGESTPVDITGIASIKNGRMTVELSDGRTAELGDVILGGETQAILYEGALDMGVDAASAQAIVNSYDENAELGALEYVYGMRQAVEYGKIGAKAFLDTGAFTADLNPKQREMAYEIGKMTAENEARREAQRKQRTAEKNGLPRSEASRNDRRGAVRFDGVTESELDETQKTTVSVFKQLFGGYGVTIEFFKSPVNERGTHTGENGSYDPSTNTIRLDINAGAQGKDTILFTAAHELTHFIKEWSPEKFKAFSEFLLDSYAKHGRSIDDLIEKQQAKAERNGRTLDYEAAYEEVVADSCETFLRDSRLFDKLLNLKQQDKSLFEKTKEYISKLFDKVAALRHKYKSFNPDSKEGNLITQMTDTIEQLHKLWEDAAMTALENSRRATGENWERIAAPAARNDNGAQKNTAEKGGVRNSFRNTTSGMANDKLLPYDKELTYLFEKRGDYIVDSFEKLVQIVNLAFDNPELKATAYFGIIPTEVLSRIEEKIPNIPTELNGVLFKSDKTYSVAATLDSIQHLADNKSLSRNDIIEYLDRMSDTIIDFDTVNFDYYYKGKNKSKGIIFKKAFADGTMQSFEIVSNTKRTLNLQTLYMESGDYQKKKSAKTLLNQKASANAQGAGRSDSKNSIRNPESNVKQKQLEIIQETNPMWDDYHTGIRTTDDIHTWAEVLSLDDETEGQFVWGDFSRADAEQALKDGTITVYSSYPIKNGVFVSTSYIQEQEYAGGRNGKVYSKTIPLTDVAWINGDEGQYAEIDVSNENELSRSAPGGSGVRFSERDYPIDADVAAIVNNSVSAKKDTSHILSTITAEQNKAINRLNNQSKNDLYRGKYTGGKHRFSDTMIKHALKEHGDFLREGLRAQLPITKKDIARHLSAIKDNKSPSTIKPTKTKRGAPSIVTSYEINGYTLYAEEITKSLGKNLPSDLIGHTMYKAPTLATAAALATSARAQPKRQSTVLCSYYMSSKGNLSTANFIADKNGNPALLSYATKNSNPKVDVLLGGLIALSSDENNFTDVSGDIEQGYVRCRKPFYITQDNKVFSNSETDVAAKLSELKAQGYDCFVFDYNVGDNYMVAVFNDAQIIKDTNGNVTPVYEKTDNTNDKTMHSYRDSLGNNLTVAQQEYFADSKVRDDNGNLMVVYHGTRNADFTIFKKNVNYFTDSQEMADSYSPNGEMFEGYLNIKKPYILDAKSEKWSKIPIDEETKSFMHGYGASVFKEGGQWRTTPADIAAAIEEAIDSGDMDYDGIIIKNIDDTGSYYKGNDKHLATDYIVFNSNQFKNIDNHNPTANEDIRYSVRDYSYESLVNKQNMRINFLVKASEKEMSSYKADRNLFAKNMIKNAAKVGNVNNTDTKTFLRCNDLNNDILITRNSFKHGAARIDDTYVSVCKSIADIIENSIVVNEFKERGQTNGSYVLLGLAENENNYVVVRSVVDKKTWRLENYQELYAIRKKSIKKEDVGVKAPALPSKTGYGTSSTISIADFLRFVNSQKMANSVLSLDVVKKLNSDRTYEDGITPSLLYSQRDPAFVSDRELLADALMSVVKNDGEYQILTDYKNNVKQMYMQQQKLERINNEIKELKQTEPNWYTDSLKKLYEEATKTRNRINNYDKKLLKLEAAAPLRVVLKRERRAAEKKQKEIDAEKLKIKKADLVNKNREKLANYRESLKKSAMRRKIRHVISDLNGYYAHGNKKKNVKIDLQGTVAATLASAEILFSTNITGDDAVRNAYLIKNIEGAQNVITRLSDGESELLDEYGRLLEKREQYTDEIDSMLSGKGSAKSIDALWDMVERIDGRITVLKRKLSDWLKRERARLNEEGVDTAIETLANAYKAIKDSEVDYIKGAYDEFMLTRIESLKEQTNGSTIRDMDLVQLTNLYDVYNMVLTTLRKSNRLFVSGKTEYVDVMAGRVTDELNSMKKRDKESSVVLVEKLKNLTWEELKPIYAFERLGSDTLMSLYLELRKGEDTFGADIAQAKTFVADKREAYGFDKWDTKTTESFKLSSGRTFDLTLPQIMSIYAYSKREQAANHMSEGGFVFDTKEYFVEKNGVFEKVKNTAEPYKLTDEDLAKITGTLTAEQKKYVDDMQEYLSKVMGAKGNEVSRELYGIDLFKELFYFPLKSSDDYLATLNKVTNAVSLRNSGMTKESNPDANNPIVLSGFDLVWAAHVNKMSLYHSFVIGLENFRRVYNYHTDLNDSGYSSVKTAIKNIYGEGANSYISKFIDDVNGGMPSNEMDNILAKCFTTFKKTAVAASLSTVIQQYTAVIRAMAEIDMKYFVGKKVTKLSHSQTWEEIKKYAQVAVLKEKGGFDAGSGRNTIEYLIGYDGSKLKKTMHEIDDKSMWLTEKADEIGWNDIWNAVKREVRSQNKGLDVKSEEFLKKCGERFTEVVTKTQVYDSVFSRNGFMRSKSEFNKAATSFGAEPATAFNMLFSAVLQLKRGRITVKKAARIVGSVVASQVLANALAALIYALRDDDEDESYFEKYSQAFLDNPFTMALFVPEMLPYVRDLISVFEGYGVERPDMSIVQDVKDAIYSLGSDTKSAYRKTEDLLGGIANLFGVPLKNVMRTGREIWNLGRNVFDENVTSFDEIGDVVVEGMFGETSAKDVNKALEKGKTDKAKQYIDELIGEKMQKYIDEGKQEPEKEAKSGVRSSVTSYWKPQYMNAVKAKDYDEMNRIRKLLYSTGLYGTLRELDKDLEGWRAEVIKGE